MRQLVDQLGAITKPDISDRAATVAWRLFNPMHVDAHTQICSASNEGGEGISLALVCVTPVPFFAMVLH